MKTLVNYLFIILITSIPVSLRGELLDTGKKTGDELVSISPSTANNYLDVIVNQQMLMNKDSSSKLAEIAVQIVNNEGMPVFSSTKSVNQFSIFTGGLPEGEYELSCQLGTTVVKRRFAVKHTKG